MGNPQGHNLQQDFPPPYINAAQGAQLEKVRGALAAHCRDAAYVDAEGNCTLRLRLVGSKWGKWKYVQWMLQVAADPLVRIHTIDLRLEQGDEELRLSLPRDGGMVAEVLEDGFVEAEPESYVSPVAGQLAISVFRHDIADPSSAFTRVSVGGATVDLPKGGRPGQASYETSMRAVEQAVSAALRATRIRSVELRAPFPKGPSVPYGEVVHLLRYVRTQGPYDLFLQGAALPSAGR